MNNKTAPVDIVVPVYNGYEDLLLCVESLRRHTDLTLHRVILIDDKSPDSRMAPYMDRMEKVPGFVVIRNRENKGFSANVNTGLAYSDRDVILLNSDTIVTRGWVDKLQRCAYRSVRIATVTPLSNAATLASVPEFLKDNKVPEGFTVDEYAELVERTSLRTYPRITVSVGFCMYVRQEAYLAAGPFDQKTFGRGYGEENDFCNRLGMLGYIHVLCDDTFIYHKGTASFDSEEKKKLVEAHDRILRKRYPSQMEENDTYCRENPDQGIRDNLLLYQSLANGKRSILYFLHLDFQGIAKNHIGGTQLHVRDLTQGARKDFNVFVAARDGEMLRLTIYPCGTGRQIALKFPIGKKEPFPVFHDEKIKEILRQILTVFDIDLVHIHHTEGLTLDIFDAAEQLKIPVICTMHDYYYACPTIKLLDFQGRYCPQGGHFAETDDKICRKCLHRTCGYGHVSVISRWREENRKALSKCSKIIFPSESAREVMLSAFPELEEKSLVIAHGSGEGKCGSSALARPGKADAEKTAAMHCRLDQVPGRDGGFSYVTGWALIDGEESKDQKVLIEVTDRKGKTFLLPAKRMARRDVADAAHDERYLFAGFHAVFNVPGMADGRFRMRIILKGPGGRSCTDGKTIAGSLPAELAPGQKDKGLFFRKGKRLNVAFLGGVTPAKGSRLLSELVHSGNMDFNFFVFGQVGDPRVLQQKCPENVFFTGAYEQEDLESLLSACRIDVACILPVWGETFCYTVSEAWRAGIPVIGTDIGAVGERIRKTGAGWLVPADSGKEQLLGLLSRILREPDDLEEKRKITGGLHLKTVSWMDAEYRALYGSIMKQYSFAPDKIRFRNIHAEDADSIFQAYALADPSVRGRGGAAEKNRLLEENQMLKNSIEMMENTTSWRLARKISEADIPGKEILRKVLKKRN